MVALGRIETVHHAGPAGVEIFLVIVKIIGVEIEGMALSDLFNPDALGFCWTLD